VKGALTGYPCAMQLSRRVTQLKPSATLEVTARFKAMKAEGVDVIGFGAGEPDADTPGHIRDSAKRAIDEGWTHYVASAGDPKARGAIAEKFRRENGLDFITPDHVVITPGAKMAIFLALQALVDPGDEVITQTPCWVSYAPMAELAAGRVVEAPTTGETGFRMTLDGLRDALTERSRVLILNSPCNPTGVVYSPEELRALAEVVNEHNRNQRRRMEEGAAESARELIVVSDEIYEKLIYDGRPFAGIAPWIENGCAVTVSGLSKSYAMTGWRVGYAAAGLPEIAKAMAKLQAQMNTSITACCYPVIVQALNHGDDDVAGMHATYARRRDLIFDLITALPDVSCVRPSGAFYVFPDVSAYFGRTSPGGRAIANAVEFADALLNEARVAVVPGDDFGGCGTNHVRLSYACSEKEIEEGLRRIREFLERVR